MPAGHVPRPVGQPAEEFPYQPGNVACGLIEREMPGIQHMHLGFWYVSLEIADATGSAAVTGVADRQDKTSELASTQRTSIENLRTSFNDGLGIVG